jgi:uncharacterized protein YndB with AHSA1/START domain
MTTQYHFVSEYVFRGDPESLWRALGDVEAWPSWWPWLKRVERLRDGIGVEHVGAAYRSTVRAPAGYGFVYSATVVDVERLRRIDLHVAGDIVGRGRFLVGTLPSGELTLSFTWLVSTTKRWMSAVAPMARPMFAWNHDRMMKAFGVGLAEAAGLELRSTRLSALAPGSPGFQVMPDPPGDG